MFSVVSLAINSAVVVFFSCLFLSRTSGIWMLIVLNWSSIVFLLSVFFPSLLFWSLLGGVPQLYFLLIAFIYAMMFFIFKSPVVFSESSFLSLLPLVLAPWVQYLCLLLIIVTIALFIFTFPLWSLLPPSHWLVCLGPLSPTLEPFSDVWQTSFVCSCLKVSK